MNINTLPVYSVGESFAETAPTSKEHLALYCADILGIILAYPNSCENHQSPLDALWDAYSEKIPFSIWHAMRGSGKTYDLALLAFLESIFKRRCGTTILGGSLEQSTKAVAYLAQFWAAEKAPRHLLVNNSVGGRGYKLKNGSWVQALAASSKSVRGPHPQKLRLDEVDEMKKEIFDAALGQPKSNYGIKDNVLIASTLHHAYGLMAEIIDNRHDRDAKLYQWCVEEMREPFGFWSSEEIARRKKQTSPEMWESEYELKRPTIGDNIYDFMLVDEAWERGRLLEVNSKLTAEAGIDWGHTVTAMHIIQDTKERYLVPKTHVWELVELTERCEEIADICIKNKIDVIYSDTSPKDSNITLKRILAKRRLKTKLIPIAFGKYKSTGIEVIRYLLRLGIIDIQNSEFKKKLQQYHYKNSEQELIAKEDDHLPDALTAWAVSRGTLLGKKFN